MTCGFGEKWIGDLIQWLEVMDFLHLHCVNEEPKTYKNMPVLELRWNIDKEITWGSEHCIVGSTL